MRNILFYKYVRISNLELLRQQQFSLCSELQLQGKIILACEGINGCLSGSDECIQEYMSFMHAQKEFVDVQFKVMQIIKNNFQKLQVRIRKEIVSSFPVKIEHRAPYVDPKMVKHWIEQDEVVLMDMRNVYEFRLGHFRDAVHLPIESFRELPKVIENVPLQKDQKIVTYCTGGIRCEKASALLREHGFTNVFQLHGGILQYGNEVGNEHWVGKCFMFDDRGAVDIDPATHAMPITNCVWCRLPSSEYHNCSRVECDARYISCASCIPKLDGCCSKKCRNIVHKKLALNSVSSCV